MGNRSQMPASVGVMEATSLDVKPLGLILLRAVIKHFERIVINSGKNEDFQHWGKPSGPTEVSWSTSLGHMTSVQDG